MLEFILGAFLPTFIYLGKYALDIYKERIIISYNKKFDFLTSHLDALNSFFKEAVVTCNISIDNLEDFISQMKKEITSSTATMNEAEIAALYTKHRQTLGKFLSTFFQVMPLINEKNRKLLKTLYNDYHQICIQVGNDGYPPQKDMTQFHIYSSTLISAFFMASLIEREQIADKLRC